MDEMDPWADLMAERTLQAWDKLDQWISRRKAKRDKALDSYLKERRRERDRATPPKAAP